MIEINETDYNDLIKRLNYLECRVSQLEHQLANKYYDANDKLYDIDNTVPSTQACNIIEELKYE